MRARESDREDKGLLGGHGGETFVPRQPGKDSPSPLLLPPWVQPGGGARWAERPQQSTGWGGEGTGTGRKQLLDTPYKSPKGRGPPKSQI